MENNMDVLVHQQRHAQYVEAEQSRTRASTWAMNQSGLLCSILYAAYVTPVDPDGIAIPALMLCGFGASWALLSYDIFRLGRALAIWTAYVGLTVGTIRYGGDANVHLLYTVLILACLACFSSDLPRYALCVLCVVTAYLASMGFLDAYVVGAGVDVPYETTFFTVLGMAACYWICDDLLKINRKFRLKSRLYVDAIGARSAQLHEDLRHLGRQSEKFRAANDALSDELAKGERVQRQLRASKEQLEQFVYAASHDLKEPLRSISGFIQLIRRKVSHHEDESLGEYFEFVLGASTGMTQLLDGLLAYSRANRDETPAEEVDLNRLVLRAKIEQRQRLQATGGSVEVIGPLASAFCSKRAAQEIFCHVLDNALKFTLPGEAPRVEIGPCPLRPHDCLYVRDYGIGIDPAFHDKVFLLFQRLNLVDDYAGAGIGLSLARKLAHANDIRIQVISPPEGPGTMFHLQFPQRATD